MACSRCSGSAYPRLRLDSRPETKTGSATEKNNPEFGVTQVTPAEPESLLPMHPKTLDAAAIGIDVPGTEVPMAYVVTDGDISDWKSRTL